ncbi:inner membrane protein [Escherichia coli]|uniref:Inner membrane protein n=1 Tax=Escherichia coli TaxID=562 RepID=A0A376MK47_ECOLX|nr:inner membrane protein [Escherichia coli]
MQWYLAVLKNYVGFSGRARRKEYWMFTLINAIVGAIINVIQLILGLEFPFLSLIYLAATIIPSLLCAFVVCTILTVSGAWALLYLVPVIGWLVLFVFACLEGNSGSNRYGNDPKFGSN